MISRMRPLSVWWVALLLVLLAVLRGGGYLVLKMDKLPGPGDLCGGS